MEEKMIRYVMAVMVSSKTKMSKEYVNRFLEMDMMMPLRED